jgi:hypothetical protein
MNFPLFCYKSKQSKLILFLGIIAILISVFKYYNFKLILAQSIIYYLLAFQSDCLVYGNCNISSWMTIIYPSIAIVIFILDYLKYFDNLKKRLKFIYEKINILNNSNFREVIEKEFTK